MSLFSKRNGKSESSQTSTFTCSDSGRSADLGTAIQTYVNNMTITVEGIHTGLIDHVYGPTYLNISSGGATLGDFKTGSADYSTKIIEQVSALFYMKAIE
jgi:hypothetical protein